MNQLNLKIAAPLTALLIGLTCFQAVAKEGADELSYPLQVRTMIYGGDLSDPQSPGQSDQKLWIQLEGRAAKAVFGKLKETSREPFNINGFDVIEKRREGLLCRSAVSTQDYRCTFQIDLINGQVLPGPIAEPSDSVSWYEKTKKTKGDYKLYSAGIGDPLPPRFGSSNLAIYISGEVAKALYLNIGPSLPDDCNSDPPLYRLRVRADHGVQCLYEFASKSYRCGIGLDLRKIKPTGAMVC